MVRRSVAEAYHYCKATTLHLQKESVLFDDSVTVSLEQIPWEFHIHFQTALIYVGGQGIFITANVYLATYFKIFKYLRELYDIQN